jgi:hypothetical protein
MDSYHFFGYLATYSLLVPILVGMIKFRMAALHQKIFLFYLLYGFLSDASRPFIDSEIVSRWMYHIFSLVEIIFLAWYMREVTSNLILRKILLIAMPLILISWISVRFYFAKDSHAYSPVFDSVTAIFISSFAAIILLGMTQQNSGLKNQPDFWFLTGTFVYFFCANFIFSLLGTEIINRVWFIHNLLNVLVYCLFTIGFVSISDNTKN